MLISCENDEILERITTSRREPKDRHATLRGSFFVDINKKHIIDSYVRYNWRHGSKSSDHIGQHESKRTLHHHRRRGCVETYEMNERFMDAKDSADVPTADRIANNAKRSCEIRTRKFMC